MPETPPRNAPRNAPRDLPMDLPMDAAELTAHRPPLLLVTRLLACQGESGLAEAVLEPGSPVLDASGRLLPEALFELVAQAYALIAGYTARQAGDKAPLRQGMLVGLRHGQALTLPAAGDTLQVHVEADGHFADFVMVHGEVMRDGEVLGQAELKLYLALDEQEDPPPLPRS